MFVASLREEEVPLDIDYRNLNTLLNKSREELHWKLRGSLMQAEEWGYPSYVLKIEPDPENKLIHLVWR